MRSRSMSKVATDLGSRVVGSVSAVSSGSLLIAVDPDAPHGTALNTGHPKPFPHVHGYILVPTHTAAIAGLIVEVTVESAPFPKRRGYEEFGLVDLPFPARQLRVVPVGTIEQRAHGPRFKPGVYSLPTVGDPVYVPSSAEARCLLQLDSGRISIGKAPHLDGYPVLLDPDALFGRHVAILGSTGSGKSCTVTQLLRTSITEAGEERGKRDGKDAATRFIVLDPNGEYTRALDDLPGTTTYSLDTGGEGAPFVLPAWLFTALEWSAFLRAKPDAQRPALLDALQTLKSSDVAETNPELARLARHYRSFVRRLSEHIHDPENLSMFGTKTAIVDLLKDISRYLERTLEQWPDREKATHVRREVRKTWSQFNYKDKKTDEYRPGNIELTRLLELLEEMESLTDGLPEAARTSTGHEDLPLAFELAELAPTILAHASSSGAERFVRPMVDRLEGMLRLSRTRAVLDPAYSVDLLPWLSNFLGEREDAPTLAVIDLSIVPPDVVHLVVAVFSRILFDTLQRIRRQRKRQLPTVLVVDEAHNFMTWQPADPGSDEYRPEQICTHVFRKIAKEGRKYGLGLVVASQRPGELDDTVLSQCNTILLHRLSNQRDFDKVAAQVPSQLSGFMDMLPVLPQRQCLVVGAAVSIPVLMEVNELEPPHRPDSFDPPFWGSWVAPTGTESLSDVVAEWTEANGE